MSSPTSSANVNTLPLLSLLSRLRPEQAEAVEAGVNHLLNAAPGREGSLLFVSPTGTGKSYLQGAIHRAVTEAHGRRMYSTFPQSEIAEAVFLKTYGFLPDKKRQAVLEQAGFWTIKRLYNELTKGRIPLPVALQHDEAHHSTDDTHEMVHGICGLCPRVGATATDYRGTAVETAKFRDRWPRAHRVLTLRRAVDLGRLSMPLWDVWPLLDDEQIDVTNGEFSVRSVESHIQDKLGDLIDRLKVFVSRDGEVRWDRATMIAVPGVEAVRSVVEALNRDGLPAVGVTGDTSDTDRTAAFAKCVERWAVLVQIRVVGEGVDLPIRRLIDLAPTTSPVLWMQRVGRITRPVGPGEPPPEYIACCHNLARHAYLWHGVMPTSAIKTALSAWGADFKPSKRFLARAIDVEGLGRFTPAVVSMADGSPVTLYVMQTKDGLNEYAIVLHPLRPDPWFFCKENKLSGQKVKKTLPNGLVVEYNEKSFGKWRSVGKLPELIGCQSVKLSPLTPGQGDWWKRDAAKLNLDPKAELTNREFQLLPILSNSRTRLEV